MQLGQDIENRKIQIRIDDLTTMVNGHTKMLEVYGEVLKGFAVSLEVLGKDLEERQSIKEGFKL